MPSSKKELLLERRIQFTVTANDMIAHCTGSRTALGHPAPFYNDKYLPDLVPDANFENLRVRRGSMSFKGDIPNRRKNLRRGGRRSLLPEGSHQTETQLRDPRVPLLPCPAQALLLGGQVVVSASWHVPDGKVLPAILELSKLSNDSNAISVSAYNPSTLTGYLEIEK